MPVLEKFATRGQAGSRGATRAHARKAGPCGGKSPQPETQHSSVPGQGQSSAPGRAAPCAVQSRVPDQSRCGPAGQFPAPGNPSRRGESSPPALKRGSGLRPAGQVPPPGGEVAARARRGVRQGGEARQSTAWQGTARQGTALQGVARQGGGAREAHCTGKLASTRKARHSGASRFTRGDPRTRPGSRSVRGEPRSPKRNLPRAGAGAILRAGQGGFLCCAIPRAGPKPVRTRRAIPHAGARAVPPR